MLHIQLSFLVNKSLKAKNNGPYTQVLNFMVICKPYLPPKKLDTPLFLA